MKTALLLALSLSTILNAQTLQTTIREVINTNPTILESLKNYNYTKGDIDSAKSGYYPKLNLSLGLGYEKTSKENAKGITTVDALGLSTYKNTLTLTQNIFNGFATTHQVMQQEHRKVSAAYSYIEKVNHASLTMVDNYLQIMKNEELLKTSEENIEINEEIFIKVQKLYDAGLTTLSEVNKIETSLALAKSNYVVQENTLLNINFNLKRVLGRFLDSKKMIKPSLDTLMQKTLEEASEFAMNNNPSLLVGKYNIKLAQASFKEKSAPYYPSLDIELSQSFNKNLSAIEGTEDSFSAMAYLKYNIFNGFSDNVALQQSISRIHQEVEAKNDLKRQVLEKLELAWISYEKLSLQMKYLKDYKKFSLKTLKLYSKEYDLGRKSLLDLLSSQNDFIGSKSQIINTEYSILFAKYQILDAMGILVSSVLKDMDTTYSNVALNSTSKVEVDTLPIYLDKDKDLIPSDQDICSNSLLDTMKNIYGCKTILKKTAQIERYSGFLFEDKELIDEGQDNFKALIKQIKAYGFKNMKFTLFGHVDNNMNKENMFLLSTQRLEVIKDMLIKEGALEENISTYSQSNKAPMYTNETGNGVRLNNRVDIIVQKLIK